MMDQADEKMIKKLREAFGCSDEQLLAEFEEAEQQLKNNPELKAEMAAKECGFQKLLDRIVEVQKGPDLPD